jgi:hypothetical protein
MERVEAQCRKCGLEFSTTAMTRTTCPRCKAAVTVRRDGTSCSGQYSTEIDAPELSLSVGAVIALMVVAGWWIWRAWGSRHDREE